MSREDVLEAGAMKARGCEVAEEPLRMRIPKRITSGLADTPFRAEWERGTLDKRTRKWPRRRQTASESSAVIARNMRTDEPVRQKIMGHGMPIGGSRGRGVRLRGRLRHSFGGANGELALLDEPTGQHGAGVFLEPLIKKGRYLLAEIGGMTKAREFVRQEGITGSGEKKIPRGLRATVGHESSGTKLEIIKKGQDTVALIIPGLPVIAQ